ncbi:MAG: 16S rRNA (cytosine(1402)-N(4))-methyltransferase RsmH [Bacillota bacterium]|nr:16S rRNA (cytosine(1402)-N(4))-methyltransferase RsmH [Bacillota bacterium]MDW7684024.1 16S rRNA (cytosine(1402)-N(4))-methyltransferase RsmH [Bacillota bacterium]
MTFSHEPVLLSETMALLKPKPGEVIMDGTVGGGGHSRAILEGIMPGGRLIAVDQDKEALAAAKETLASRDGQIDFVHNNFGNIKAILSSLGIPALDGILLDIGVSSHQLDEDERGFSFHADAPLDMRMNLEGPVTAADLVNTLAEDELSKVIRDYGEELWARRIAQFIVTKRKTSPIDTTGQLVDVIKAAIPARARRRGPHPARRTFQALRIAVNDELGVLERAVTDGIDCLRPGGRLVIITFHSLEDRIVKKMFQQAAGGCQCPPGLPQCVCGNTPLVKVLTGKPVQAADEELSKNPRARSAKLRAAVKVLNREEGE